MAADTFHIATDTSRGAAPGRVHVIMRPDHGPLQLMTTCESEGEARRVVFFANNAGYSHGINEDPLQGRIRCARELARAEVWAARMGYWYEWSTDDASSLDFDSGGPPRPLYLCSMHAPDGDTLIPAQLLGGIDLDPCDPCRYQRVVEAELALEEMYAACNADVRDLEISG